MSGTAAMSVIEYCTEQFLASTLLILCDGTLPRTMTAIIF